MRTKSKFIFGLIAGTVTIASVASVAIVLTNAFAPKQVQNEQKPTTSPLIKKVNLKERSLNFKSSPSNIQNPTDQQKQEYYNQFFEDTLYKSEINWQKYFDIPIIDEKLQDKFTFNPIAKCYDKDKYIRTIEITVDSKDPNILFEGGIKSIFFNILVQSNITIDSPIIDKTTWRIKVPVEIDAITANVLENIQSNIKGYYFEDYANSRLQIINDRAFSTFENIKTLDFSLFPKIKVIMTGSFVGMPNISEIYFPNTIQYFQYGFLNCNNLKTFQIPNNWVEIKKTYFQGCSLLWSSTKCIIPDSMKTIENNSFITNDFPLGIYFPSTWPKDQITYKNMGIRDLNQVYVGGQKII